MENPNKEKVLEYLDQLVDPGLAALYDHPASLKTILNLFGDRLLNSGVPDVAPAHDARFGGVARAKRPLNAFMAFRTYYLKMFPDTQQKYCSGFLTKLWNQDPRRNKWALIAKVYSFIRDHVGKGRINLSAFLGVVCPMMKIIHPDDYLQTLGWDTAQDAEGNLVLRHDRSKMSTNLEALVDNEHPITEFDLLTDVLTAGYFGDVAKMLQARLWASQHSIMSPVPGMSPSFGAGSNVGANADADADTDTDLDLNTAASLYDAVPTNPEKTSFVAAVHHNAYQAAQEIFGPDFDSALFQSRFVHYWEVEDVTSFENVQISIPDAPMATNTLYNFERNPAVLPQVSNFNVSQALALDTGIIDVSSAWSVDRLLVGQKVQDAIAAMKASQKPAEGEYRVYHNNI
ncbi:hypothetical protein HG530_001913 [Fusarium avenaceum]|nr:putative mating type protein MAT-1-1 [Fusarium avenaceum]KAI6775155.1 hypothetical protein HG530_001913 [Fusarium avenaceum]